MRYPEHTLFVRRIALGTTTDGKPRALFRSNPLNPRANWGKPVPTLMTIGYEEQPDPVLYFDKYAAPLHAYYPLLVATAHHPLDENYMKISYDADPSDRPSRLRETFNTGLHAALLRGRDQCILKMFLRLVEKEGYVANDALRQVSIRFEVGERALRRVLADAGWEILGRAGKVGGTPMGPRTVHKLSRAYEYHHLRKELETAARAIRANEPGCSFSLEDLAVEGAPGGYPTHCPVTGVELEYGIPRGSSMRSPKVCRINPTEPALTGNVMVASKLGRGIVEGTMAVGRIVGFMRKEDDMLRSVLDWVNNHRVADPIKVREVVFKLEV